MRPVRKITAEMENFRVESVGDFHTGDSGYNVIRRDPVEPEPVGTIVLMAFRIAGYDPDCDGSLMGRFEHIDKDGETTGWRPKHIGLYPACNLVVTPEEWAAMFQAKTVNP